METPDLCAIDGFALLSLVLFAPVLVDGVGNLGEPRAIFAQFQNIRRSEKLNPVWRRIAERLEQVGVYQRRNIVRLAIEHPTAIVVSFNVTPASHSDAAALSRETWGRNAVHRFRRE